MTELRKELNKGATCWERVHPNLHYDIGKKMSVDGFITGIRASLEINVRYRIFVEMGYLDDSSTQ